MENFSFQLLWGDARTLLFSAAILALAALIGFLVYVLLYKSVARFTRKSTSILHLLLAKQIRPPVRYVLPLLALTTALPTTPLHSELHPFIAHSAIRCPVGSTPSLHSSVPCFVTLWRRKAQPSSPL